jgi:hypothetical protein
MKPTSNSSQEEDSHIAARDSSLTQIGYHECHCKLKPYVTLSSSSEEANGNSALKMSMVIREDMLDYDQNDQGCSCQCSECLLGHHGQCEYDECWKD